MYIQEISGERLQDHWSSGLLFILSTILVIVGKLLSGGTSSPSISVGHNRWDQQLNLKSKPNTRQERKYSIKHHRMLQHLRRARLGAVSSQQGSRPASINQLSTE